MTAARCGYSPAPQTWPALKHAHLEKQENVKGNVLERKEKGTK
jgi:hypothetical protein